MKRLMTGILLTVLLLNTAAVAAQTPPPTAALAPPDRPSADRLYVGETGHVVQGGFRALYLVGGGQRLFGWPLTEEFDDRCDAVACTVQYFERARFEYDPVRRAVAFGALGREALAGRAFAPGPPVTSTADRRYFAETGQTVAYGFLAYWNANGGAIVLGLPLSPEISEEGRTVQYFERGRLDYFADRPASRSVEMAELGGRALVARGWSLPARLDVVLSAEEIPQGRPLALRLTGAVGPAELTLDGASVVLHGDDATRRALIGLAPWAEPGPRRLALRATAADGTPRLVQRRVTVRAYDFPRERLRVPPGQGDLLAPEVLRKELGIVQPLYAIVTGEARWSGTWRWPTTGRITTEFATRRAYDDGPYNEYHGGVDIAAPAGQPVVAPAAGRVAYAGTLAIRGNFVAIDHGLGLLTTYFHLSELDVRTGDDVTAGQQIGRVGSTGLSTGPHLHWEARIGGTPVDARTWLANDLLP